MDYRRLLFVGFLLLSAPCCLAEEVAFDPAALEFFEKEVRPVLIKRCYECHSAASKKVQGGLRVDSRAGILNGGDTGSAVDFGELPESLLLDAINYGEIYQMPPKSKLPESEIAALTKWVEMKLPWPPEERAVEATEKQFDLAGRKASHWAWRPIADPPIPNTQGSWSDHPIDRFILSRLEQAKLAPAAPADRRTLIRRAYFDLIGLPPSPDQVHAFLADESPDAFARVVDERLRSPHFSERWGRHWLDLMRYAESRGHEFDYDVPNAYQYRDYVIRALNADVPYDQFVVEHLAGDLLAEPRLNPEKEFNESILGTGFWFLGEWVHSPVDIRKDETDRFDNMVDVFSKSFLGLTVACARCHDHKFDAISQDDYYALFGYLQSSAYRQARFQTMEQEQEIAEKLAALEERYRGEILKAQEQACQPVLTRLPEYLLAAREAILAGPGMPSQPSVEDFSPELQGSINELATQRQLESRLLSRWVAAVLQAAGQVDDPLHAWSIFANDAEHAADRIGRLAAERQGALAKTEDPFADFDLIIDYARSGDDQWLVDGPTFGLRPVRCGEIRLTTDAGRILEVATYGAARRDPTWNGLSLAGGTQRDGGRLSKWDRAGKTIRTPTFDIDKGIVYALVNGQGHCLAVVDSHRMINGPLHGRLIADINGKGLRWYAHDLRRYQGHNAHLEFIGRGNNDLEVLQVVQGDRTPPMPEAAPHPELTNWFAAFDAEKPELAARNLAKIFQESFDLLSRNAIAASDDAPPRARLGSWLVEHRDLFGEVDLQATAAKYLSERDRLTDQIQPASQTAMAMWDGSAVNESLLVRGNPRTPGHVVPRRLLEAISGPDPAAVPSGSGRLELAQEMISPTNPFTSRVMVNRIWHHLLGRGIVPSVDNFGVLGELPTHPELLDHLAVRFMAEGWSVKQAIRYVMLSQTYQMSSKPDESAAEIDPMNALLHRARIRRLEAETIRDTVLAVSGRLDRTLFGPSVSVHLTNFMQGRGRPASGPVDGNGRRSIYIAIRRNFLSPMMLAFDMPQPFSSVGKRNVSNVPAQALIMMNDPLVVQQSDVWAKRLLAEAETTDARLDLLYETAFARLPSDTERADARGFLSSQGAEYGLSPEKAETDARVWKDLCHVMMNVKEFIFVR